MNSRKLYNAINNIEDDLIEDAREVNKTVPIRKFLFLAATLAVLLTSFSLFFSSPPTPIDLTERIVIEEISPEFSGSSVMGGSITADLAVNIEGKIIEVGKDGLSFKLDNGKWIFVTDETIIGQVCTSIEEKESLFFEPTFRVGNMMSGFTADETAEEITAYAIYTNWNWEDPIRD